MRMHHSAILVVFLGSSVVACSGGGSASGSPFGHEAGVDTGGVVPYDSGSTTTPPRDSGAVPVDAGADTGAVDHGKTTGRACSSNADCDVTGDGINQCSEAYFAAGSLYPTPVCIGTECDPGTDSTKLMSCDGNTGWCLDYGTYRRCYAQCQFSLTDGATPTGCVGKDVCQWLGTSTDASGGKHGVGDCFGGCIADGDCPTGEVCQREYGECVKPAKKWSATLPLGSPCTVADRGTATISPRCDCWLDPKVGKGYCSTFCRMGDSGGCPLGFTCDAQLPATDSTGAPEFTAAPRGLAGACLKNCTTDSDCTSLGGYCDQRVGTGRKTCQFGARP